jgi:hypothetical protein
MEVVVQTRTTAESDGSGIAKQFENVKVMSVSVVD